MINTRAEETLTCISRDVASHAEYLQDDSDGLSDGLVRSARDCRLIEFKPHRQGKQEHDHDPDQRQIRPLFRTSGPKAIVNIPLPSCSFERCLP